LRSIDGSFGQFFDSWLGSHSPNPPFLIITWSAPGKNSEEFGHYLNPNDTLIIVNQNKRLAINIHRSQKHP